jgi:hypothetical protein
MAVIPLLRPSGEARALLHHILQHGDIVGRDTRRRTIIQLAVDDRTLEKLMTFDADAAELEDGGDGEPDDDAEEDGPGVAPEVERAKVVIPLPQAAPPTKAEASGSIKRLPRPKWHPHRPERGLLVNPQREAQQLTEL